MRHLMTLGGLLGALMAYLPPPAPGSDEAPTPLIYMFRESLDLSFDTWSVTPIRVGPRGRVPVWSPGAGFDPSVDLAPISTSSSARGDACPQGMLPVRGTYLRTSHVDVLQRFHCLEASPIPGINDVRCARYDRAGYQRDIKDLKTRVGPAAKIAMNFCIDQFQFPNREGVAPTVALNWHEAGALCALQGKRLCSEREWTFACEGEDAWPSGTPDWDQRRSAQSGHGCNVGANLENQSYLSSTPRTVEDYAAAGVAWNGRAEQRTLLGRTGRMSEAHALVLASLYGGHVNGQAPGCTSPFGVRDMSGGVDEWTTRVGVGPGHPSILKGGYWGPVRNRCRPKTGAHGPGFVYYNIGFRCCSNAR